MFMKSKRDYAEKRVIIYAQPKTAVFWNKYGHVVIRQEWPFEDDMFVTIAPQYLPHLVERLAQMHKAVRTHEVKVKL